LELYGKLWNEPLIVEADPVGSRRMRGETEREVSLSDAKVGIWGSDDRRYLHNIPSQHVGNILRYIPRNAELVGGANIEIARVGILKAGKATGGTSRARLTAASTRTRRVPLLIRHLGPDCTTFQSVSAVKPSVV